MICALVVLETCGGALSCAMPISVMTYLSLLCVTFALTSAQDTIIQNKNVNIIVNVDPEEVARELWKVIEARLNNSTGHLTINSQNAIKDLEKVVIPLVSPNRRSLTLLSAFQVATALDQITRRVLNRDTPGISLIDQEIMTRDIVADMMVSLKMIQSKVEEAVAPSRRMYDPVVTTNDDERDDYVNVRMKIHRQDIFDAFY